MKVIIEIETPIRRRIDEALADLLQYLSRRAPVTDWGLGWGVAWDDGVTKLSCSVRAEDEAQEH